MLQRHWPTGIARRRLARLTAPGGLVLDVGCGDFRKAFRYLYGTKRSLRFVGLERFPDATIYGENDIPADIEATGAFRRLACDIEHEPFPLEDDSVDGIFCSHVIEHIENKPRLAREIARVLRCGGYAYIETPSPRSLWMSPRSRLYAISYPAGYPLNFADDESHVGAPLSLPELEAFARAANFETVRKGHNRELGIAGFPVYALMFAAGLLPVFPSRLRGLLLGAGWWNLIGWPEYVLLRKRDTPHSLG